uniref:NADAR domain-containing protein n=1 Tax=Plectus sambesii TaxID=2011161 RepID=A0A914W4A8_9BILA
MTPATLADSAVDERVVVIGNETDILHSGYTHAFSEGGRRYPSADHYAHAMTLRRLGLDDALVLELLATPSSDVTFKAMQLVRDNMPAGHDMDSLASYLAASRDAFTMQGLRLRFKVDSGFERALMETADALLVVCDDRDSEFGVGMGEQAFLEWMRSEAITCDMLGYWLRNDRARPPTMGKNKLGMLLMWLRHEVRADFKRQRLSAKTAVVDDISSSDSSTPAQMTVSEMIVALDGVFRPLSNFYAVPTEIKGERYRSVEHYAYQRLFEALDLDEKMMEKLKTTVEPSQVWRVAEKVLQGLGDKIEEGSLEQKMAKLDRWRMTAMKYKINVHPLLKRLLLTTGDALIVETANVDELQWSIATDEKEIQHLLTKSYIGPDRIVNWMTKSNKLPRALSHIGANKTGLYLMELRGKLRRTAQERGETPDTALLPLVAPCTNNAIKTMMTQHMICFTAESVFHPLYPAEVKTPDGRRMPTPMHWICEQGAKYFGCSESDITWLMEATSGREAAIRYGEMMLDRQPAFEKLYQWEYNERLAAVKLALRTVFEQHPPLLRVLLDTGDSLLVYCQRFSSRDSEWAIGMRERDLRIWCAEVDVDTKELMDLCARALADRPPFLGGNRLGVVLMELRREFVLKGVFPQQLPELNISNDAILGTDSPTENWDPLEVFDPLSVDNYIALWANPLLLLAKHTLNAKEPSELWALANTVKTAPHLVPIGEPTAPPPPILQPSLATQSTAASDEFNQQMKAPLAATNGPQTPAPIDPTQLDAMDLVELRTLFMTMVSRVRDLVVSTRTQQNEMDYLRSEIERVRRNRRELEERRRKRREADTFADQQPPTMPHPPAPQFDRLPSGADRNRMFGSGAAPPPPSMPNTWRPDRPSSGDVRQRASPSRPANGDARKAQPVATSTTVISSSPAPQNQPSRQAPSKSAVAPPPRASSPASVGELSDGEIVSD